MTSVKGETMKTLEGSVIALGQGVGREMNPWNMVECNDSV